MNFQREVAVQVIEDRVELPRYERYLKLLVATDVKEKAQEMALGVLNREERLFECVPIPQEGLHMTVVSLKWRLKRACELVNFGPAAVWWFERRISFGALWSAGLAFAELTGDYPTMVLLPSSYAGEVPLVDGRVKGWAQEWFPLDVQHWDKLADDVFFLV